MRIRTTIAIVSVLALAGCGGSSAEGEEPTTTETTGGEGTTTTEATGPELADMAWADVPDEQRGQWMSEVVVPAMEPLFQEHDPERFAEFGCATCHGEDAREVGFEMPNGVAPLDPTQIPAMFQSDQPMAVFMTQTVWPQMTQLLGEQPYDQQTGEGFSCLNCHATAEGEAG